MLRSVALLRGSARNSGSPRIGRSCGRRPAWPARYAIQSGTLPPKPDTGVSGGGALEFLILTASRTGEIIGAQWDEVDLNE